MTERQVREGQLQEEAVRRKEQERKQKVLGGSRRDIQDALIEDVARILLAMDPTVDRQALSDPVAFEKMLREKYVRIGVDPWNSVPHEYVQSFSRNLESAKFRAATTAFVLMIDEWLTLERERCAKIAETWSEWTVHTGYDCEEYAAEEIAARIRSGE